MIYGANFRIFEDVYCLFSFGNSEATQMQLIKISDAVASCRVTANTRSLNATICNYA